MNSREKILSSVKRNQPDILPLPDVSLFAHDEAGVEEKFISILEGIGGKAYIVNSYDEIMELIQQYFGDARRIVTTSSELPAISGINVLDDPHLLADIDLAIVNAHFGVAENAAVWLTEEAMGVRALPFICQYLAVVLNRKDIVPTMHQAYDRIGAADYNFGTFIAGPSKTADIEQSLVLGAHGPKGMTVFLID